MMYEMKNPCSLQRKNIDRAQQLLLGYAICWNIQFKCNHTSFPVQTPGSKLHISFFSLIQDQMT